MYIEIIVIVSVVFIVFIWAVWHNFSKWRLLKKYKPENDEGKRREESRGREQIAEKTNSNSTGFTEPPEREFIQNGDVKSSRKDSNGTRGFFKIRRNRRR